MGKHLRDYTASRPRRDALEIEAGSVWSGRQQEPSLASSGAATTPTAVATVTSNHSGCRRFPFLSKDAAALTGLICRRFE
jgi:hypothetical protein